MDNPTKPHQHGRMRLVTLLLSLAAGLTSAERWPGVKVTFYQGANFDRELMTCYDRELRFDGFVPLRRGDDGHGIGPFSVRWETELKVDKPGEYTFRPANPLKGVEYDLWIDGKAVEWTTCDVQYKHRRKTRTRTMPITKPIALSSGYVPVRMELCSSTGSYDTRVGHDLMWKGPFPERAVPAARVWVRPWREMKRKPLLRFGMIGHSNVEGRTRAIPADARTAWVYLRGTRMWKSTKKSWGNHSSAMATALSLKYPNHFFGGMMLGRAATSVNEDYVPEHRFYKELVLHLRRTESCGVMIAMGTHFDWDEMKKQSRVDAFESAHVDLITRVREVLGRPQLPWIFTRVSPCFAGKGQKPGPGSGRSRYRTLYQAADKVAAAIPPMGIVTTDDFLDPGQAKAAGVVADCGPEGNMHYTNQGYRKWTERAMPFLEEVKAVDTAVELLSLPVKPYPVELPSEPRYPTSIISHDIVMAGVGEVVRISQARPPKDLGPYPNALFTVEYKWVRMQTCWGYVKWPENETVVVVVPSVRDRQPTAAVSFKPGDQHHLQLLCYDAQPEAIKRLPLDDNIQNLEKPLYYARVVNHLPADKGKWLEHRGKGRFMKGFKPVVDVIMPEDLKEGE